MRISIGERFKGEELSEHNGYGYATARIVESLTRLGHTVKPSDADADVEIWFDQPSFWDFSDGPYRIGYHPWESTLLQPANTPNGGPRAWADIMNECDEIWTPSPLIADWYRRFNNITVPVHVYEHGVDPIWTPIKRERGDGLFKFLHVGAEANRKGAKEAMVGYRSSFAERRGKDVILNMKMISEGWSIGQLPGINYINKMFDIEELVDLFHDNHVFLYPSWGEGFGLNPLQALATGMPTITLPAWAPYAKYIHPELAIPSHLAKTEWPRLHPGLMFKPDQAAVTRAVRYAYDNYEELVDWHVAQVPALTTEYSWDTITERVFTDLEERLKNK